MAPTQEDLAALLFETMPLVFREFRQRMTDARQDMTVPQFRALGHLRRNPGTSLSDLATALGIALPQASKLVERLVRQKLVTRVASDTDRRQVRLQLAEHAMAEWRKAREAATHALAERLGRLDAKEREALRTGLQALRRVAGS